MNITRFDVSITIGALMALILMSFIIPGLGLVDADADTDNLAEYNVTTDRFDFAGEFPADVDRKELGSGTINITELPGDNFAVKTPKDGEFSGVNESDNYATETWEVRLGEWDSGLQYDSQNVSAGEDFYLNDTAGYQIQGDFNDNGTVITYRVVQGSTDDYAGIIGGIYRIADIIYWFVATIVTMFLNLFGITYDIVVYLIGMFHWLLSSYSAMIGATQGYVTVIAVIPSSLLMYEFAKVMGIMIEVLWIG